ncbi:MAG: hypothetical protein JW927_15900 [Deltaproteobacteria bacterium]|nr:hypothetical protein [Deltaproteobacteria bacterium]
MKVIKKGYQGVLILFTLILMLHVGCSSDKEFKFTFNRQDGETYVQKLSISRERLTGADSMEMEDTLLETRVTCRKIIEGWDIESQTLNTIMMKNGEEIQSPLFALISKLTITYRIDSSGNMKDLIGYDRVLEAVKSQYPPEVAENVSAGINIDAIRQREFSEWKNRVGDFLGKKFSIGDTWEHDASYILPNGDKISYRVKTLFKEKVQQNSVTCVLIEQTYDSAGDGLTVKDDKHPELDQESASINGMVTRIIDPATMRIYKEEVKREIHMSTEMPITGKIPEEIVETRTYDYEYGR